MEATNTSRQFWRSRWWMPAFCLSLGALVGGAARLGEFVADVAEDAPAKPSAT